jgi:hypothetical protein
VLITRQPIVETYFSEQFLQSRIFGPIQTCACELSRIEQGSTSSDGGFPAAGKGTYTTAAFPDQGALATFSGVNQLAKPGAQISVSFDLLHIRSARNGSEDECFYEKVIKVKADVSALLYLFLSDLGMNVGLWRGELSRALP